MLKKCATIFAVLLFLFPNPSVLYGEDFSFFAPPEILAQNYSDDEDLPTLEELEAREKEEKKKEEGESEGGFSLPFLFHNWSLRGTFIISHLRGDAIDYRRNDIAYDQMTETGVGAEVEISTRFTKYWYIYTSLGIIQYTGSTAGISERDTSTDTTTFSEIEFDNWTNIAYALGFKFFPFEEEVGFLPFLKVGMGVTYQEDLTGVHEGNEQVFLEAKVSLAFELAVGLEYRFFLGETVMGAIVVEAFLVRIIERDDKPLLIGASKNGYAFPIKLGAALYF